MTPSPPESTKGFRLTRLLLVVMLTAVGACAAVGVLVLLFGTFDDTSWRILGTCATIAYTSLTGLGCAVALERELLKILAVTGMVISFSACVLLTIGIWTEFFHSEEYGKACTILSLFAGALAHTSLLSLARLRPGFGWSRVVTAMAAFLLAIVLSGMLVAGEEPDEGLMRVVGVLSILVAAGTLTVPILHRLSGIPLDTLHEAERPEEIELVCPRCHRRQRLLLGEDHCASCELEILVEVRGWEERPGEQAGS